jgi:hypothetical protein
MRRQPIKDQAMDESQLLSENLQAIESYIGEQRKLIEKGKALDRLMANPDFQLVVLNGYIEAEATKLFSMLTDPNGAKVDRDELLLQLECINHFKGYVGTADYAGTVKQEAEMAPGNIHREEIERMEITARAAEEE